MQDNVQGLKSRKLLGIGQNVQFFIINKVHMSNSNIICT